MSSTRRATRGDPEPALDADRASDVLQSLFIPRSQRARLFDTEGHVIADSYVAADRVESRRCRRRASPAQRSLPAQLPPAGARPRPSRQAGAGEEVGLARAGDRRPAFACTESGGRVVSVSIPIEHVRAVLGVLTLESGDVDQIIAAERDGPDRRSS